ncbi:MAG TPA: FixH family protein [Pseudomonadales bacterium]|jgi:hypothetical protein
MKIHAGQPWYRQFWPWLLIGLPATAVIACIITIVIAIRHTDPVVSGDWYKDGMAINQLQERDTAARDLGLQAFIKPDGEQGLIVTLTATTPLPERVQMTLHHPTRDDADITRIVLLEDGVARTGPLPIADINHWYVNIESLPDEIPSWRIRGRWRTGSDARIVP